MHFSLNRLLPRILPRALSFPSATAECMPSQFASRPAHIYTYAQKMKRLRSRSPQPTPFPCPDTPYSHQGSSNHRPSQPEPASSSIRFSRSSQIVKGLLSENKKGVGFIPWSKYFDNDQEPDLNPIKVYIVGMARHCYTKSDYESLLRQVISSGSASERLTFSITDIFNMFGARLSDEEAENLSRMDGVVYVRPNSYGFLASNSKGFRSSKPRASLKRDVNVDTFDARIQKLRRHQT